MYGHLIGNAILLLGGLPYLWKLSKQHLDSFNDYKWTQSEVCC